MALRIQLTVNVRAERNEAFQDSLRSLAERSREGAGLYWTTYETRFGALAQWHFMNEADQWADLSRRGNAVSYIRNQLGEAAARPILEELYRSIVSSKQRVKRIRPELSYLPEPLDGSRTMALLHLSRARLGWAGDVEDMIREVALAIPKVDDRERMITHQSTIGEVGVYSVARWGRDEADLDGQLGPDEILGRVHGSTIGTEIWRRGLSAMESAERWILVYRADLSNPRPRELSDGVEIVSP